MNKTKNYFNIQLFAFTIVITILFVYLHKIEDNIKNYNEYKNSINNLYLINLNFNNFLEKKDKFVNFDEVVEKTKSFESITRTLRDSNISKDFGSEFTIKLDKLITLFEEKKIIIERFKSIQASNLNSLHFIHDLNKELIDSENLIKKEKNLVSDLVFSVTQYFINLHDNKEPIAIFLEEIKGNKEFYSNEQIFFLYNHCVHILKNIDFMRSANDKSNKLNLKDSIEDIYNSLVVSHDEKLSQQQNIASIFFFFILLNMFFIYREHKKLKKVENELSAFRYAIENSDNSIVLTNLDRNITYVNDNLEKNSGYTKEELIGSNPNLLSSGLTDRNIYSELNEKLDNGEKWEGEFINKRKDGTIFYEKASIVPIIVNDIVTSYLAIKLDVTKYKQQNEQLELASIAFDNIQEAIVVANDEQEIIAVNKAFELITGYEKDELIGQRANILKSGHHDKVFYNQMWDDLEEKGYWKGKVYDKKKDGEIIPIWLNLNVVRDKYGKINKYIAVLTSLKDIIESQERADFLAYHDSLTKLPNRARLEDNLKHSLNLANRNDLNLFVLFLDLDRFKVINDTLGHNIGDELLKTISKRILNILRETDIVARMGGDEFIVVLDSSRDKKSAGYVCEKLLEVISEPIEIDNNKLNTSASIGVAMYPNDGEDITTLIKNADTAMYHAKKLGKNNFQYYDEQLSIQVHEQLQIELALKQVIENNELFLNYQPQYSLKTRKLVGFEALVRWIHPELGFVSPDKFISIAEDTGTIIEIGKFIFDVACRDYVEFKKLNKNLEHIAINISSVQFKDENFVDDVVRILDKYGLKSDEVELEVTERYIMEFSKTNMQTIDRLRELGFKFSIDDFGTGYSSMSYLTKLPIDVIKVDKAFVDGTPNDNNNVQISKAIVALSKSLGYKVVAEGIENSKQEEYLKTLDCEIGQGYFYSKPLDFENALEFTKKN